MSDPLIDFDLPDYYKEEEYLGVIVNKRWGYEEIIVNNDLYCGKIITINPGHHTSYHKHLIKDETLFVLEGECMVYSGTDDKVTSECYLPVGSSFRIEPGMCHTLCAVRPHTLKLIEFSTHDDVNDSYRVLFPLRGKDGHT